MKDNGQAYINLYLEKLEKEKGYSIHTIDAYKSCLLYTSDAADE